MNSDEVTLEEMLADPIVRLLMQSDGVTEAHVRAMMDRLRIVQDLAASARAADLCCAA